MEPIHLLYPPKNDTHHIVKDLGTSNAPEKFSKIGKITCRFFLNRSTCLTSLSYRNKCNLKNIIVNFEGG